MHYQREELQKKVAFFSQIFESMIASSREAGGISSGQNPAAREQGQFLAAVQAEASHHQSIEMNLNAKFVNLEADLKARDEESSQRTGEKSKEKETRADAAAKAHAACHERMNCQSSPSSFAHSNAPSPSPTERYCSAAGSNSSASPDSKSSGPIQKIPSAKLQPIGPAKKKSYLEAAKIK